MRCARCSGNPQSFRVASVAIVQLVEQATDAGEFGVEHGRWIDPFGVQMLPAVANVGALGDAGKYAQPDDRDQGNPSDQGQPSAC